MANIMDAYLGAKPPSPMELERLHNGYQQSVQMFGNNYQPMTGAMVYADEELIETYRQNALDNGVLMDQLEVPRYTHENIFELSKRSVMIMASAPNAAFSGLINYKVHAHAITDIEIRDHSYYHTGIDYGPGKSLSVHVDQDVVEVPTAEERLAIAYNNQLLDLIISSGLDEEEEE